MPSRSPSPNPKQVSWADEKLGELLTALERLGLSNGTLVLANGDHGKPCSTPGVTTSTPHPHPWASPPPLAPPPITTTPSSPGWHLGEHGHWCKEANTELATRVPLIVRDGRRRGAAWAGGQHHALVELVDIYRTLCELAGVPVQPDVAGYP